MSPSPAALSGTQQSKAQKHLGAGDENTEEDQDDDDPREPRHFRVRDTVGQDLREVEEDAAALVEDLDAVFDFEVFAHGVVEGV